MLSDNIYSYNNDVAPSEEQRRVHYITLLMNTQTSCSSLGATVFNQCRNIVVTLVCN